MFRLQLQIIRGYRLCALLILLAFFGGCAGKKGLAVLSGTTGSWYAVTKDQTPFYHYGPQQGNGADQQLERDSLMKVIRPSFGYVKVQLQSGQEGYVASEDIRPASATLVAAKFAPPLPPPTAVAQGGGEEFRLNSDDPRLIAPPEPLPESSPTPAFHY
jgi:hypothetical protein